MVCNISVALCKLVTAAGVPHLLFNGKMEANSFILFNKFFNSSN